MCLCMWVKEKRFCGSSSINCSFACCASIALACWKVQFSTFLTFSPTTHEQWIYHWLWVGATIHYFAIIQWTPDNKFINNRSTLTLREKGRKKAFTLKHIIPSCLHSVIHSFILQSKLTAHFSQHKLHQFATFYMAHALKIQHITWSVLIDCYVALI